MKRPKIPTTYREPRRPPDTVEGSARCRFCGWTATAVIRQAPPGAAKFYTLGKLAEHVAREHEDENIAGAAGRE